MVSLVFGCNDSNLNDNLEVNIRDIPLDGQITPIPGNPKWLQYSDGSPFFMAGPGDPEGFLYRGELNSDGTRNGDQNDLIHKLAATGANCIYLMAVRSHGGDGNSTENPFFDHTPAKGINPDILAKWEEWFTKMDEAGIVIFFIFYDDSAKIWYTGDKVDTPERQFIHTIVNKFEHHKHLIWCIAEEYSEAYSAKRVHNIAVEIRKADNYDHVIAVHKLSGLNFYEFANDANIDQFAFQYNEVSTPLKFNTVANRAWRKADGRYNINYSEANNFGKGEEARKKCWAIAMGGAYVMVFGMDIKNTAKNDLRDLGSLVHFFQSTDYYEMSPHNELACAETEYILSNTGKSYILYTSKGEKQIGINALPEGVYKFTWFDIKTGITIIDDNKQVKQRKNIWNIPKEFSKEIALYLVRKPR